MILTYSLGFDNSVRAEPLKVATGEWSPYTTSLADQKSSGSGGGYGMLTAIVTATLQEMGQQPDYGFFPWDRTLDRLRAGEYRVAYPYRKTQQREAEFLYSAPIYTTRSTIFYNLLSIPNPSRIKSEADLKPYRAGLIEGYSIEAELEGAFKETVSFKSELQAFEKLVKGEIDLLPAELISSEHLLTRYFGAEQHKTARLINFEYPGTLHLIAPKNQPGAADFIERFNQALERLRRSGIHRDLINRYRLPSQELRKVRLVGPRNFPLAVGTLEEGAKKGFLIPRGTSAIVIEWNRLFTEEGDFDIHKDMYKQSRVKILEGPLKDYLLYVPNMYLSFD